MLKGSTARSAFGSRPLCTPSRPPNRWYLTQFSTPRRRASQLQRRAMFEELHVYYNRELEYLRNAAGEFAEKYPKIAGRLRLSPEAADDPHVERLLQGCAFISARIHRKLDDDFPELT